MAKTVAIGKQDFSSVIENGYFYIDKTNFIKEWWENGDDVTLITRPGRFGKTLTLSMTEQFFSTEYAGRSSLFEGLNIWKEEKYQKLQGTYPVIFLSFANVKGSSFALVRKKICQLIVNLFEKFRYILSDSAIARGAVQFFERVSVTMDDADASLSLYQLSEYLYHYYGKKVIILLDEYDTPMQEAYLNGYWNEAVSFMRELFNSAFKTNPCLERAIMTGITRVSRESVFSDLNNLKIVTTTSNSYETVFGFTEEEVFQALGEYGLSDRKQEVKRWYDGFSFGSYTNIYNPWSVINFLNEKEFAPYWANTSSNGLADRLVREGDAEIKTDFEKLLGTGILETELDEQVIFSQLDQDVSAVWSLFAAAGYLKVQKRVFKEESGRWFYTLSLTNYEVRIMFEKIIRGWFAKEKRNYNIFIKALLTDDVKMMNRYMNKITLSTFSYFDVGNRPSEETEPERFYHGFVLGLMAELADRYSITSNRESGFGRYDVMLEPNDATDDAIIIEFKVHDSEDEKSLEETVSSALKQIEDKAYAAVLTAKGTAKERIRRYGFAFKGKTVLIRGDSKG